MKIACVLPAYNEEPRIGGVIKGIIKEKYIDQIIVVDDCSDDNTYGLVKKMSRNRKIRVYRHIINRGAGAATYTGIQAAIKAGAGIIVTIDSDGQHRPEDIKRLVAPIERNEADVVIGSRFLDPEREMPLKKSFGNRFLNMMTMLLFGMKSTDTQSGFKAFSRDAAERINVTINDYGFCSEIIGEISRNKLRMKEIPIKSIYLNNKQGTRVRDGIKIAIDLVISKMMR